MPPIRLLLIALAAVVLTGCDGYIEEVRVRRDGEAELAAEARVVCTDPLQIELFGGDPCSVIDTAVQTGEVGELPFGLALDPDEVSFVASGEADRRTLDVLWRGPATELSSVLVDGGTVTALDDQRTEVIFKSTDTPAVAFAESTDPDVSELRRRSRWDAAQFRINAPDLVVEHNGDRIQGRIVIWNIDGDQPEEFRVVWTTEEPERRWWWLALGAAILFGVVAMMIGLERPGRPRSGRAHDDGTTAVDTSGS